MNHYDLDKNKPFDEQHWKTLIKEQYSSLNLPSVNSSLVTDRMKKAMENQRRPKKRLSIFTFARWKPKWAAACIVIFAIIGVLFFGGVFETSPIKYIPWNSEQHLTGLENSLFWNYCLHHGRFFNIPKEMNEPLMIHLKDGSILECSPGSRLAIQYSQSRRIKLKRGEIEVQAAHQPNNPLFVETPLTNVEVVGTLFYVKVLQTQP